MPTPSVTEPVNLALSRTGEVLFRPFKFSKWAAIAVGATLTLLGRPAGTGSFNNFHGKGTASSPSTADISTFFHDHLAAILIISAAGFLFLLALYVLICWLKARGEFMLLDNIVNNTGRVRQPWAEHRGIGNSLFRLLLIWSLLSFSGLLLIALAAFLLALPDIKHAIALQHYDFTGWSLAAILVSAFLSLIAGILFWLAASIIFHLAVPVMFIRHLNAWPAIQVAWRELVLPHKGTCILYFLMLIVIGIINAIWSGLAALLCFLCTCCTFLCVAWIPFIGLYPIAFLSLPMLIFTRSYKLYFISQFGDAYRIQWQIPIASGFEVLLNPPPPPQPQ